MPEPSPTPESFPSQFGEISTRRDLLGDADALLQRYGRAIRGYLLALLHDEDAAHDVLLALRVKMMDGRFARWVPGQGRFRFYLKKAVLNEALQYLRKHRNRRLERQVEDLTRLADSEAAEEPGDAWLGLYRQAVLQAALKSLRGYQEQHPGNVFHTLVGLLTGEPGEESEAASNELSDAELAQRLGEATGRNFTVVNVAQQKRRARQKFAELLALEVKATLESPTPGELMAELRHLGLFGFIGDFLPRSSGEAQEET